MGLIDRMRQRLQSREPHFAKIPARSTFNRARRLALALAALILLPCANIQAQEVSQNKTPETAEPAEVFRFHMPTEPHSLDPARLSTNDASYFMYNVMRGLYVYREGKGLVPEGARSCVFLSALKLRCELSDEIRWNDGKRVLAEDYVRAFRHLVSPEAKGLGIELLASLKNARLIYSGQRPSTDLGVRAEGKGSKRLVFEFEERDPEFLYKLASSVLVPIRSESFPEPSQAQTGAFNGPYQIKAWKPGHRVRLEPNPHYRSGSSPKDRPPVEILFVDEDETALSLYKKGILSFLRRLPTHYIPQYKGRDDFFQVPVARFDYVGFGPELKDQPELRAALSLSLDFSELQRIYDARGIPGCPGLDERLYQGAHCLTYDLKKAQSLWAQVPADAKKKRYRLGFSRLGGDDVQKGAEWLQAQWQTHLGLRVDLEPTEQGVYLQTLKKAPPALFRKGVALDRPTCLAALENFKRASPENYIRLGDDAYEKTLRKLASSSGNRARKLCAAGLESLLEPHLLIPLGRIHFTLLVRPEFQGWRLNELNQLDLSNLRRVPTRK